MLRNERTKKSGVLLGIAAAGLLSGTAHAEALLAKTGLIQGSQSFVFSIDAPTAGTFDVSLSDLEWPERLSSLSFAASTSTAVLNRISLTTDLTGTSTFKVSHPGSYYALVSGTAQGSLDMGLYSLKVNFTPVPLPAAALLFISSLAGFAVTQRKRHVASLA